MKLKALVGSGDNIVLFTLPFLLLGFILNMMMPSTFTVGGPSPSLKVISIVFLVPGVVVWVWSVVLILVKVPRRELITTGPYSVVKHPLYTGVAFLVLPWIGFLLDTWAGIAVGLALYGASRLFSPEEEKELSRNFGPAWDDYRKKVKIPWL